MIPRSATEAPRITVRKIEKTEKIISELRSVRKLTMPSRKILRLTPKTVLSDWGVFCDSMLPPKLCYRNPSPAHSLDSEVRRSLVGNFQCEISAAWAGTRASAQPLGVEGGAVVHSGGFELLVIAGPGGFHGPGQQVAHLAGVERLEILHDLQVLLEYFHAVDAGDDGRGRQREGVGQTLLGCGDLVLDDGTVSHGLHAEDGNSLLEESRNNMLSEAAEAGVEQIERHLTTVEMELVFGGDVQHPVVDDGVFVAGEADVADLAGFLCLLEGFDGPAVGEAAVGILHAQVLVDLHEVDVVGLQPLERFVDLAGGGLLCASVKLGHEEDLLAVAVAQRLAHPDLAFAVVVVPAVVHESDAAVDGGADELDAILLLFHEADMVATEAERGNAFAGTSERTVEHVALAGFGGGKPEFEQGPACLFAAGGGRGRVGFSGLVP